jgi:hypothetical protein
MLTLALAAAALTVGISEANAQRDAGAKMRGEFGTGAYSSTRSAGRYLQSANDGCQDLYQYTYTTPAVAPPVAKKASEDVSKNVDAAKKDLGAVRKEAAGDKAVQAKLDAIEKHLAAAMDHHKMMHEECCKDHVDADKTADCCSDMLTELEKAQAEHRALMRLLNPPKPATADKPKK